MVRLNLVPRVFRLPTGGSGLSSTTPSCGKTKDPGNEVGLDFQRKIHNKIKWGGSTLTDVGRNDCNSVL